MCAVINSQQHQVPLRVLWGGGRVRACPYKGRGDKGQGLAQT